uniref:Uncharacterized protein n=1 Tax=Rhizophora mucronata TaxID=61149 RepID=A0A2P2QCU3_RHIMU
MRLLTGADSLQSSSSSSSSYLTPSLPTSQIGKVLVITKVRPRNSKHSLKNGITRAIALSENPRKRHLHLETEHKSKHTEK